MDVNMAFSVDSKVKDILKDPGAAEVLGRLFPDLVNHPQLKLIQMAGVTVRKVGTDPKANYSPEQLEELDKALKALG